jgi:hypothetical protein
MRPHMTLSSHPRAAAPARVVVSVSFLLLLVLVIGPGGPVI